MDGHRLAEERSLAYHRAVVARIRSDPAVLERARARVRDWLEAGIMPHYAREWDAILGGAVDRVCAVLVADNEASRALRQATPFAGVVDPRERWRIWKCVWKEMRARVAQP